MRVLGHWSKAEDETEQGQNIDDAGYLERLKKREHPRSVRTHLRNLHRPRRA